MSVPVPPKVPAKVRVATVSLPPRASVAPAATLTLAVLARTLAPPRLSVPLATVTVSAPATPRMLLLPVEVSAPTPSASEDTVPLLSV